MVKIIFAGPGSGKSYACAVLANAGKKVFDTDFLREQPSSLFAGGCYEGILFRTTALLLNMWCDLSDDITVFTNMTDEKFIRSLNYNLIRDAAYYSVATRADIIDRVERRASHGDCSWVQEPSGARAHMEEMGFTNRILIEGEWLSNVLGVEGTPDYDKAREVMQWLLIDRWLDRPTPLVLQVDGPNMVYVQLRHGTQLRLQLKPKELSMRILRRYVPLVRTRSTPSERLVTLFDKFISDIERVFAYIDRTGRVVVRVGDAIARFVVNDNEFCIPLVKEDKPEDETVKACNLMTDRVKSILHNLPLLGISTMLRGLRSEACES